MKTRIKIEKGVVWSIGAVMLMIGMFACGGGGDDSSSATTMANNSSHGFNNGTGHSSSVSGTITPVTTPTTTPGSSSSSSGSTTPGSTSSSGSTTPGSASSSSSTTPGSSSSSSSSTGTSSSSSGGTGTTTSSTPITTTTPVSTPVEPPVVILPKHTVAYTGSAITVNFITEMKAGGETIVGLKSVDNASLAEVLVSDVSAIMYNSACYGYNWPDPTKGVILRTGFGNPMAIMRLPGTTSMVGDKWMYISIITKAHNAYRMERSRVSIAGSNIAFSDNIGQNEHVEFGTGFLNATNFVCP